MKVISLQERQLERLGQELGDTFVLMAKSHFAAIRAVKDIVAIAASAEVNKRALDLANELEQLELLYKNQGANE